ncbi:MAG TPA: hypothetical protein VGR91_19405, partial [Stellaceae bacterium]|nr:hypothetical protein [Stellaceae bacterium]
RVPRRVIDIAGRAQAAEQIGERAAAGAVAGDESDLRAGGGRDADRGPPGKRVENAPLRCGEVEAVRAPGRI